MATFIPGTPVDTGETSSVDVEVNPRSPLAVGRHQFRLVVVDDSGNESEPFFADVIVIDNQRPTAVITPARLTVPLGQSFKLSGADSTDIGGKIVKFVWTLMN
jgi:hypothetical protein